jgi:hypothetical protein
VAFAGNEFARTGFAVSSNNPVKDEMQRFYIGLFPLAPGLRSQNLYPKMLPNYTSLDFIPVWQTIGNTH